MCIFKSQIVVLDTATGPLLCRSFWLKFSDASCVFVQDTNVSDFFFPLSKLQAQYKYNLLRMVLRSNISAVDLSALARVCHREATFSAGGHHTISNRLDHDTGDSLYSSMCARGLIPRPSLMACFLRHAAPLLPRPRVRIGPSGPRDDAALTESG